MYDGNGSAGPLRTYRSALSEGHTSTDAQGKDGEELINTCWHLVHDISYPYHIYTRNRMRQERPSDCHIFNRNPFTFRLATLLLGV